MCAPGSTEDSAHRLHTDLLCEYGVGIWNNEYRVHKRLSRSALPCGSMKTCIWVILPRKSKRRDLLTPAAIRPGCTVPRILLPRMQQLRRRLGVVVVREMARHATVSTGWRTSARRGASSTGSGSSASRPRAPSGSACRRGSRRRTSSPTRRACSAGLGIGRESPWPPPSRVSPGRWVRRVCVRCRACVRAVSER